MNIEEKIRQLRMVLSLRDDFFVSTARPDKGDGIPVTPKSILPMFDNVINDLLNKINKKTNA
jgi:hypothetical protein